MDPTRGCDTTGIKGDRVWGSRGHRCGGQRCFKVRPLPADDGFGLHLLLRPLHVDLPRRHRRIDPLVYHLHLIQELPRQPLVQAMDSCQEIAPKRVRLDISNFHQATDGIEQILRADGLDERFPLLQLALCIPPVSPEMCPVYPASELELLMIAFGADLPVENPIDGLPPRLLLEARLQLHFKVEELFAGTVFRVASHVLVCAFSQKRLVMRVRLTSGVTGPVRAGAYRPLIVGNL
jgi:hypothetical protein